MFACLLCVLFSLLCLTPFHVYDLSIALSFISLSYPFFLSILLSSAHQSSHNEPSGYAPDRQACYIARCSHDDAQEDEKKKKDSPKSFGNLAGNSKEKGRYLLCSLCIVMVRVEGFYAVCTYV
eukprot:1381911-Amorphochlora_amoeboformis.AAC.1